MIRRGPWKFIWASTDPSLLYNLEQDPLELTDLSKDDRYAGVLSAFEAEVSHRWNVAQIRQEVIESQVRRRLVGDALRKGKKAVWDHQPLFDTSKEVSFAWLAVCT